MTLEFRYLCEFDLDCITHSTTTPVTVRKLALTEKKTKGIGICTHPECMRNAEYEVIL